MKLTALIWVLALASAVAACNSGPPINCKAGERVDDNPLSPTLGRCIADETADAVTKGDAVESGCQGDADAGCSP